MNETQNAVMPETIEGNWMDLGPMVFPEYARLHTLAAIESLAQDLKRNGQLQNIVVSKEADPTSPTGWRYEVVIGRGRVEAARKLGWEKIRADVKTGLSKSQKLMMTLSENNEREDASPFYTGKLYKMMMDEENLDQTGLAQKLGKDRTLVAKYLSLADAPPELEQSVNQFTLGLAHCLEIVKAGNLEDQKKLAQECHQKKLSVKAVRTRVKQGKAGTADGEEIEEAPTFAFSWKAKEVAVKPRRFRPFEETQEQYVAEFADALKQFCGQTATEHPSEPAKCESIHTSAEALPAQEDVQAA